MTEFADIYRRLEPALRALLIIILPPALAEAVQHAVVWRSAVYAAGGAATGLVRIAAATLGARA